LQGNNQKQLTLHPASTFAVQKNIIKVLGKWMKINLSIVLFLSFPAWKKYVNSLIKNLDGICQ
jgi:hypothetical protein